MSKRRHRRKASHHRRRKRRNPFEQVWTKGGKKVTVGPFLTAKERAKDKKALHFLKAEIKKLKKSGHPMAKRLAAEKSARFAAMAKQIRHSRKHIKQVQAELHRLKAQGWRRASASRVSEAKAIAMGMVSRKRGKRASVGGHSRPQRSSGGYSKRKYGIIGREGNTLLIRKKDGSIRRVAIKGRKRKHSVKGKSHSRRRKSGKRARFIKSTRKGYRALRLSSGRVKYFKIRGRKRKNPSHRRRKHARKHRAHRRHRLHSNPRRRRGHRKHGKRRNPFRRNPMGIDVKKILTAGNPKQAGYVAVAAAVSGGLSTAVLAGLDKVSGGKITAWMGAQQGPMASVAASLPALVGALAVGAAGQKFKSDKAEKIAEALALVAIVDLAEGLVGAPVQAMIGNAISPQAAAALSGVSYTPMGRPRGRRMGAVPRGLRGVDFTRSMGAIPHGMGSHISSPGGTLSTAADFGGLTHRDNADFGASRQAADFGGVDFTMGAIPSMRGAHTGDSQYPDPTLDADGNEDDTHESHDHTV